MTVKPEDIKDFKATFDITKNLVTHRTFVEMGYSERAAYSHLKRMKLYIGYRAFYVLEDLIKSRNQE